MAAPLLAIKELTGLVTLWDIKNPSIPVFVTSLAPSLMVKNAGNKILLFTEKSVEVQSFNPGQITKTQILPAGEVNAPLGLVMLAELLKDSFFNGGAASPAPLPVNAATLTEQEAQTAILTAIRNAQSQAVSLTSQIFEDANGVYYLQVTTLNESGVPTFLYFDTAGAPFSPTFPATPIQGNKTTQQIECIALASGMGYTAGDLLLSILVLDLGIPGFAPASFWWNLNTSAPIAPPPSTDYTFDEQIDVDIRNNQTNGSQRSIRQEVVNDNITASGSATLQGKDTATQFTLVGNTQSVLMASYLSSSTLDPDNTFSVHAYDKLTGKGLEVAVKYATVTSAGNLQATLWIKTLFATEIMVESLVDMPKEWVLQEYRSSEGNDIVPSLIVAQDQQISRAEYNGDYNTHEFLAKSYTAAQYLKSILSWIGGKTSTTPIQPLLQKLATNSDATLAAGVAKPTYAAAVSSTTFLGALLTDVLIIRGSASATIKIKHISFTGTQTTGGNVSVQLVKRTAANTGGTPSVLAITKFDSSSPNATAVVSSYSGGAPLLAQLGAGVTFLAEKAFVPVATADPDLWEYNATIGSNTQDITLRGINEYIAVNLGNVAVAGNSLSIDIVWTEE
jgi:hypothetical protein